MRNAEMLEKAKILIEEGVCDICLGRQFANCEEEDCESLGKKLRDMVAEKAVKNSEPCILCGGIFSELELYAQRGIEILKKYEFDTFMVGCRMDRILEAVEESFLESLKLKCSVPFKVYFNRVIEKRISSFFGKRTSRDPDIILIYDLSTSDIEVQIKSLYIYGRYRKLVRGIPQTRWNCRECNGKGCERCNFTGKMYSESVEELIAEPFLELTGGKDAKLHGAGREDVDARMLGSGRPFILEIKEPFRRVVDLVKIAEEVKKRSSGKVEVLDLKFVSKRDVEKLKSARLKKKYRALVVFNRRIEKENLEKAIKELSFRIVDQRTPTRVLHRRADILRKRKVYQIDATSMSEFRAELIIEADSGLYIKELISGDGGRTRPSLAELLGVESRVEELDVIEVEGGL